MRFTLSLIAAFLACELCAQVGSWDDHLPYSNTIDVAIRDSSLIYCATPYAVFSYDYLDRSVERFTKANVLSDVGVSAIAFSNELDVLIVGYSNGNLDLVSAGGTFNAPDIQLSQILGDKTIREIVVRDNKAYLACGFGVVVYDLLEQEVSDSWFIGPEGSLLGVNDIVFGESTIHAATDNGILVANINSPFLADFQSWEKDQTLPDPDAAYLNLEINGMWLVAQSESDDGGTVWYQDLLTESWAILDGLTDEFLRSISMNDELLIVSTFGNIRYYNMSLDNTGVWGLFADRSIRANDILITDHGYVWVANDENGLFGWNFFGAQHVVEPSGPFSADVRRIEAYNNNVWICSGGVDASWVNNFNSSGSAGLVDGKWVLERDLDDLAFFDIMDASINPLDNKEVYFGSWFHGLARMYDGVYTDLFDTLNSTLSPSNFGGSPRVGVGGLDFDATGNLWFSNNKSETPLHVRTPDGSFTAFDFGNVVNEGNRITEVLTTFDGLVWCLIPDQTGLLVLNPNGTPSNRSDDSFVLLGADEGSGGLPSKDVICMEEDLDGEMWVGLLEGLVVFYSQDCLFEGGDNCDAQQILITQDGNVQILLETETINAIEIDGSNRKWVATANSGVYLLSEDGTQQVHHFTAENSPLLANNVVDIAINQASGEVFLGTEKGVISYRGDATNFFPDMENVLVFPNPVEPDYDGDIVIDGLAQDVDVKISDIAGNVVFQTESNGGRAVWNGKDFSGNRVSTGVYLVYVTSDDGKATEVSKVAMIR